MFIDNRRQEALQYVSNFKDFKMWEYSLGSLLSALESLKALSGGYVSKAERHKEKGSQSYQMVKFVQAI